MRLRNLIFGLAASLLMAAPAMAQVSGFVGVTNDYVARGVSNTAGDTPAIQGVINYQTGDFYIGGFGSTVDFDPVYAGDETSSELDVFFGYAPTVGAVTLDFGVLVYNYTNDPIPYEFEEFKVGASGEVRGTNVAAAVYYTDNFFGTEGKGVYYELVLSRPLTDKLSLSGGAGYQALLHADGQYGTVNAGLNYALTPRLSADLRYHWTDRAEINEFYEDRITVNLRTSF
jgi:uncharacterized protein (TIGR02001 family)